MLRKKRGFLLALGSAQFPYGNQLLRKLGCRKPYGFFIYYELKLFVGVSIHVWL